MLNLLRLNLQYFAADGGGAGAGAGGSASGAEGGEGNQGSGTNPGGQGTEGKGGTGDGTPPEGDKTFTQEDVNNIATKEAQKTDAEKKAEKLTQLEKTHADTQAENETLKAQISAAKAGVNTDSVEDVVTLAKNLVGDDVDMDAAIKQVIEKYPHFSGEQQTEEKPKFSTGTHSKKPTTDAEQWVNAFK